MPTLPLTPRTASILAAACLAALAACGGQGPTAAPSAASPRAWNHDPGDPERGPAGWGSIDSTFERCLVGTGQSPVDIASPVPTADLPPLEFSYPAAPLVVENTGHTIEVAMPTDGDHTLTIGDDAYRLVQYHFHAPSEHTVDGEAFDVEAHLVHQDPDGQLAVVGVFLDEAAAPLELLDTIAAEAPDEAGEVDVDEDWSPMDLLPVASGSVEVASYLTYPGSLTTPGCEEGVRWIVLRDTLGVSPTAVDRLHDLIAAFPGYDGYPNNNRPTQPMYDREIQSTPD